jgi:hypothetical protein
MKRSDWFGAEAQKFQAAGDPVGLRMLECNSAGFRTRETDPDASLASFAEGRRLAEQLGEPWWVLFFEKKRIEALIHFKRDYRQVLDLAVKAVLEVSKPTNLQCPERVGLYDCLVAAYLGIDAEGYEKPIREALATLDAEIPEEPDSDRYLLWDRRLLFALECGRLNEAYDAAMAELNLAASDANGGRAVHFATFVFCELCRLAGFVGDWKTLADWAGRAEELAREVGHECELSEALAWQGVAAQRQGDGETARRRHRTATAHAGRLQMPPKQGYFEALEAYHEGNDDPEQALAVRDAELKTITDKGRLLYETRVRIKRLGLLQRLGRLTAGDAEAARGAARKLKQPDKYLRQIDEWSVAAGLRGEPAG